MEIFEPFDEWADAQLERLRGNPVADAVFTTASEVGDFSLIWQITAAARGIAGRDGDHQHEAFVFSALLGLESLIVNQGVKRLFRRIRPTESGDPRFPVRKPSTSSFPSGHASAAFTAAGILSEGDPLWPLYYGLAVVVSSSRVYTKMHHASDVVAGAAIGVGLAAVARRLWPKP